MKVRFPPKATEMGRCRELPQPDSCTAANDTNELGYSIPWWASNCIEREYGVDAAHSRRIEIRLERIDRDSEGWVGVRTPKLCAFEHYCVEPLRVVSLVDCHHVRKCMAAVHQFDHADAPTGVARQPRVHWRMNVLGPHSVAG